MNTAPSRLQRGLTLAELLVASTIGILVIGGAIAVFSANQNIQRTAEQYQLGQDDFRYVSQIINRVVRDGVSFAGTTTTPNSSTLVVTYPTGIASGTGTDTGRRNCLGSPLVLRPGVTETNQFALIQAAGRWQLQCTVGNQTQTLIEWPASTAADAQEGFTVSLLRPSLDTATLGSLVTATATQASSVEVTLRLRRPNALNDVQMRFVTTMRCRILNCPNS
jgi:Tfp pilus assembly protein PilW